MTTSEVLPSSFRDPAGFLFKQGDTLYRQINNSYAKDYDTLISSGLYAALIKAQLLIPHEEVEIELPDPELSYKTIQPQLVPFISYPYEWSFSQLKDAALATMTVQRLALKHGMSLKDASAYNIQFHNGRAVLIDSLSFMRYEEGKPWQGYKQYCQHFLSPLALMCYSDVRLSQLLRVYIDGIPLDLASKLLPARTKLSPFLLSHIHAHAKDQQRFGETAEDGSPLQVKPISRKAMEAMMQTLHAGTRKLQWQLPKTEWGDYYSATNYEDESLQEKENLVREYLTEIGEHALPVHDLGANNGHFSRVACELGYKAVAWDIDPVAVEKNYLQLKKERQFNLLPLLLDLTNPSGAIGWSLTERDSFCERINDGVVMALALIHHLAISNNVPLTMISAFLKAIAQHVVIEFIPKSDSQVRRLLANRTDIFTEYSQEGFESAFTVDFEIVKREQIRGSERSLYLLHRKNN